MDDRTDSETEQDQELGESSWQAHRLSAPLRSQERRRSINEGGQRSYDIPVLSRAFDWPTPERDEAPPVFQRRFNQETEPPLTPSTESLGEAVSVVPQHEQADSRLLRPLPYLDSQYGRHHSAPLYGSEDWDRRMSFRPLPPPREGSASRVVLPPVSHLLEELGILASDGYEQGPVLPQLRLPEEPGIATGSRMEEEEGERRVDAQPRGKKGGVEMGGKGEEKRVVRKIYVACDFCRGRKLKCDGGRPRCSNCETRSLACRYQEHPRRRGPGKAPKGSRGRKAGRKSAGDPEVAGPTVE